MPMYKINVWKEEIMEDTKKLKCRGRNWRWTNAVVRGGRGKKRKDICRGEEEILTWIQPAQTIWHFFVPNYRQHTRYACDDWVSIAWHGNVLKWRNIFFFSGHGQNIWSKMLENQQPKCQEKKSQTMFPSTPLKRYFTSEEHFYILAQIPHIHSGSAAKISQPMQSEALILSPLFFLFFCWSYATAELHFSSNDAFGVCWLKSENLPLGSEISFS